MNPNIPPQLHSCYDKDYELKATSNKNVYDIVRRRDNEKVGTLEWSVYMSEWVDIWS